MSYQEAMNVILPHQGAKAAHITGHYGEVRAKGPHGGSDFNYAGGQAGVNLEHPGVHSPIAGEVTFVGGQYGTIKIRDADGNSHELLHTATQSVKVGQRVEVGDEVGHMGGHGPKGANQYAQHVHYQMKDAQGHAVNPETFWKDRHIGSDHHHGQTDVHSTSAAPRSMHAGDEGAEIKAMQVSLNQLGYKDGHGHALQPDGKFGEHTKAAVEQFQRDHGLRPDGMVGSQTAAALKQQIHPHPQLDHPSHPHHAMFRQAEAGVHRIDAEHGRTPDTQSVQLAGALTASAAQQGMHRIDHVELSTDARHVYAMQGDTHSPFKQVAGVATHEAVETPLTVSSELARQVPPAPVPANAMDEPNQAQSLPVAPAGP